MNKQGSLTCSNSLDKFADMIGKWMVGVIQNGKKLSLLELNIAKTRNKANCLNAHLH
jgi:hypothetical protein